MEKAPTTAPETRLFDPDAPATPPKRTFGLRAVDGTGYALALNTSVFAVSVFFDFLNKKGHTLGKDGSLTRYFGTKMKNRADRVDEFLINKINLPQSTAQDARTVFWSFFDGTLLMPLIKKIEDNRGEIAHQIDRMAGTEPDDPTVYENEPKQTWKSVLGARAITAGIVTPTAILLEKAHIKTPEGFKNLNEVLFYKRSEKWGPIAAQKWGLNKHFSDDTIQTVSHFMFFEGFYTTVCTIGQYFISRNLARRFEGTSDAPASFAPGDANTDQRLSATPEQTANLNHPPALTDNVVRLNDLMQQPKTTLAEGAERSSEPLAKPEQQISHSGA